MGHGEDEDVEKLFSTELVTAITACLIRAQLATVSCQNVVGPDTHLRLTSKTAK